MQSPDTTPVHSAIVEGLQRTMQAPIGTGSLDLILGASQQEGAFASLEADYRATAKLGLYAKAAASTTLGSYAGVGMHLDF